MPTGRIPLLSSTTTKTVGVSDGLKQDCLFFEGSQV